MEHKDQNFLELQNYSDPQAKRRRVAGKKLDRSTYQYQVAELGFRFPIIISLIFIRYFVNQHVPILNIFPGKLFIK